MAKQAKANAGHNHLNLNPNQNALHQLQHANHQANHNVNNNGNGNGHGSLGFESEAEFAAHIKSLESRSAEMVEQPAFRRTFVEFLVAIL